MFAINAGSRGSDFHRWHMSKRFFRSNIRSVIAESLNVGGGVRLIKPAKLYICMQNTSKHYDDGRTAPNVHGHGPVPLNHSRNVVTRIGKQHQSEMIVGRV